MSELKNCPFCGGPATMMICTDNKARMYPTDRIIPDSMKREFTSFCVRCSKCSASTKAFRTKNRAFTAWNKRPEDEPADIVRCRDCVNWMPRHIKLNDGTTRFYLPGEKDVSISVGINVGSQCLVDCNSGYAEDKAVFRSANEFCSRGIRREGSEGSE